MADGTVTVSRDVTIIPPTPALHLKLRCLSRLSQVLFTLSQDLVHRSTLFLVMAQLHNESSLRFETFSVVPLLMI